MNSQVPQVILVAALLVSCSHGPTSPGDRMSEVSGYLEGWQPGVFHETLYFSTSADQHCPPLDSAQFSPDGSFSFRYPFPAPPDSTLHEYQPVQLSSASAEFIDSLKFSGADQRYVLGSIYAQIQRGGITCSVKRTNALVSSDSAINRGDFYCEYLFSRSPIYVSGWKRTTMKLPVTSTNRYRVFVTRADCALSTGWNSVTIYVESIHDSTIEYRISNRAPDSAKWFQTWAMPYNFGNSVYL